MKPGTRVDRLEDAPTTAATILYIDDEAQSALIAYDEGGQGWWPLDCLNLQVTDGQS